MILTSLYPGSHISLHVHLLQNDGGAFAASVNALTLALQNAGLPMQDMVCACTVGLCDTTPLLDLNFSERSNDTPEVVCATLVHSNKVVMLQEENKVALTYLPAMVELAIEGNNKIYEILKQEVGHRGEEGTERRHTHQSEREVTCEECACADVASPCPSFPSSLFRRRRTASRSSAAAA